jgi:hypothetical protein
MAPTLCATELVLSVDPSSTTSMSAVGCHFRSSQTTRPTLCSSFHAGITTRTLLRRLPQSCGMRTNVGRVEALRVGFGGSAYVDEDPLQALAETYDTRMRAAFRTRAGSWSGR